MMYNDNESICSSFNRVSIYIQYVRQQFFFVVLVLLLGNIYKVEAKPVISFKRNVIDFGIIKFNPKSTIRIALNFRNIGDEPLVINNIETSCSCTKIRWTKCPVSAGMKGFISVSFKMKGSTGYISKDIIVQSNAKNSPLTLHLTGKIY